ncbi:MAG: M20/M25/M40 family metallo-hydrolase [Chloroflexi bacterium]|nr:M20/M25/M40 family metallo-hydrolase [Chloroflexota bacterium]
MSELSDLENKVCKKIEELKPELIKLTLDLSNIDATQPNEKEAGDYVFAWCKENGFEPKKIGAPDRFNVLGKWQGTGKGSSLLFCSHLDAGKGQAWREGDVLHGHGVANCKGPMACWMVSTKAIKDLGIKLPGDVLLSAVIGETGGSPVDEFESPKYDSQELGARYVASHGGIADYALVAEASHFAIVPMMTGLALFKITVYGGPRCTAWSLVRPEPSMEKSVNAIVRMNKFIERFEQYASEYMKKNTYSFDGGTVIPNALIGAIRAGHPTRPFMTQEECSIYCDFRVPPGKNPLDMKRDLEDILEELGIEGKVEIYKNLPGYEAWKVKGFDTLKGSIVEAHTKMFNKPPENVKSWFVSMWRDLNPYNEIGIPSISYGFPTGYTYAGAPYIEDTHWVKIPDMITAAKIYALVTLNLCNQPARRD